MVNPTAATRSGSGLLRVIGRVLLWACVILLLVRGVAATIADRSHLSRTVTVTVVQKVRTTPTTGGGGR